MALTHHVIRSTRGKRVLFAAAGHSDEPFGNAAVASLTRMLQGDTAITKMELTPLDTEATAQLVARVAPRLDSQRVFVESDGNPLFIKEIARAMSQHGGVLDDTLSDLIGARLNSLQRATGELIPWIAVLGRRFNLDVLAAVSNIPSRDMLSALTELERQVLIRPDTGGGYEFVHDLIRQVAYQRMSAPARRMIHLQIARVLQRAMERAPVRASEVAYHAEQGGDHELAAGACVLAGRHGLRMFAYEQVEASTHRGLRQLEHIPVHKRLALHLELLALYCHSGMMPYWPDDLEARLWALHDQARAQGQQAQIHAVYRILAMLFYQRGGRSDALSLLLSSEYQDTALTPSVRVDALAQTARCMGLLGRYMRRAGALVGEAEALVTAYGLTPSDCALAMARGLVAHHDGALDVACQAFERALARARSDDPVPWWEYYCLSRLPMIELERGEPRAALLRCDALTPVADQLGPGGEAPFAVALRALSESACRGAGVRPAVDQALARLRDTDCSAMLAYVQNIAAGLDLAAGDRTNARSRSQEALQAAIMVEECSEAAIARARLGECSDRADAYRDALAGELESPDRLSARARHIVQTVLAAKNRLI